MSRLARELRGRRKAEQHHISKEVTEYQWHGHTNGQPWTAYVKRIRVGDGCAAVRRVAQGQGNLPMPLTPISDMSPLFY